MCRARAGAPFTIGSIAFDRGPPLDENQMSRVFIVDKHLDAEAPVECSGSGEDVPKHRRRAGERVGFQVDVEQDGESQGRSELVERDT